MEDLFSNCQSLFSIPVISNLKIDGNSNIIGLFKNCFSLLSINSYNSINKTNG